MPYGLSDNSLKKLIAVFQSTPEIDEVILFGSRAKGNFREGSDVDLALKGSRLTLEIQRKIENKLQELFLPYSIDLLMLTHQTAPQLVDHINRVGITIYSRQDVA